MTATTQDSVTVAESVTIMSTGGSYPTMTDVLLGK